MYLFLIEMLFTSINTGPNAHGSWATEFISLWFLEKGYKVPSCVHLEHSSRLV